MSLPSSVRVDVPQQVIAGPLPVQERGGPTDPSHDEYLRKGIIHTSISRSVAWGMVAAFLLAIYAVPLGQFVLEHVRDEESVLPALFREIPTKESLARVEDDLEETSYAKEFVQPRVQLLLSRFGREGNEKAVIGRDGYLFYKPGIAFVSNPGFLDPDTLELRERGDEDTGEAGIVADPRPAILAFHALLRSRGIQLVLFPVPDKAMLQPRQLHGRVEADAATPVARSRDFARLMAELKSHGVLVFDPTPERIAPGESDRFLIQDTHWTPSWMQEVAAQLAAFVLRHVPLARPQQNPGYSRKPVRAARVGDIVDMLKLPEEQTLFLPQEVSITQVVDSAGEPFEPSTDADLLLLGDSFTNIFTEEFMGWGSAAGFAPQLAAELGRPIDVIAQNDSGAFATRAALALELEQGTPRLDGKKVVVWEFAARELAVGNWKHIEWKTAAPGGPAR